MDKISNLKEIIIKTLDINKANKKNLIFINFKKVNISSSQLRKI